MFGLIALLGSLICSSIWLFMLFSGRKSGLVLARPLKLTCSFVLVVQSLLQFCFGSAFELNGGSFDKQN